MVCAVCGELQAKEILGVILPKEPHRNGYLFVMAKVRTKSANLRKYMDFLTIKRQTLAFFKENTYICKNITYSKVIFMIV